MLAYGTESRTDLPLATVSPPGTAPELRTLVGDNVSRAATNPADRLADRCLHFDRSRWTAEDSYLAYSHYTQRIRPDLLLIVIYSCTDLFRPLR